MKMNLKNRNYKKLNKLKIKLTSKNLFIFLISFSIISIFIGIVFYLFLNSQDKIEAGKVMVNIFKVSNKNNYLAQLKTHFIKNTFSIFIIWLLGISVIGSIANIFIYFCELFSLGFTIATIIGKYHTKGILASLCYLFPSNLCYLLNIFLLTFFSIKISYKLTKLCFSKQEINIKNEIEKYFKVLIFSFITVIIITITEVFIDPYIINLFFK